MKIALISCTKTKKAYKCTAREMYSDSQRFSKSYKYAKKNSDRIFILSAKYGLIHEDEFIEPYDLILNNMSKIERDNWADMVRIQINLYTDVCNDDFIILAGKRYYEGIVATMNNYNITLEGMKLGEGNSYLDKLIDGEDKVTAIDLHKYFSKLPKYSPSTINQIPFKNGIYILFDKEEQYKWEPKIVRVGTHTGDDNLIKRLKSHFLRENQRSSIFRKNIGRCLLSQVDNEYLKIWNRDYTAENIDKKIESEIERSITKYLERIEIVCIEVNDKETRLRYEDGIISTIANDQNYNPSHIWLGNISPKEEIRKSGLWCVRGTNGVPLSMAEYNLMKENQISGIRVQKIKSTNSSKLANKSVKTNAIRIRSTKISDIVSFLEKKLENERCKGRDYIDIKAGELAKEYGIKNRTPSVCSAMRKVMKENDEILKEPPMRNGTNVVIRYYFC